MVLASGDQENATLADLFIDRPDAMPTPWLDALAHGVVENDGNVALVDVEFRATLGFQFFLGKVVGHECEILARNAVALRSIAVTPVRKTDASHPMCDEDDVATDFFAKILLKDAAIVDFNSLDQSFPPAVVRACHAHRAARPLAPR